MASPASLELTVIAVHQNALGIDDVDLFGIFVEVEEKYAGREDVGVLIILLGGRRGFAGLRARAAMTELPEKLAVAGEFHDGVAARAAGKPDVSFAIDEDAMFSAGSRTRIAFRRPSGHGARSSPAL